jgi:hypothetical protein
MTDPGRAAVGFDRLTSAEANRALYIDFEGRKDEPPVLLGVQRRGRGARPFVHQVIVDAVFSPLSGPSQPLVDAVANVVRRAERRDRRIVAWSEHELRVVRSLTDVDAELIARFEARYVNARRVAERWRNKLYGGDKPETGALVDYLALIDYEVPPEAAGGRVGETIGSLRPTLERGSPPTERQRDRWQRLLEHNRFDCAGMRRVCLRAATELGGAALRLAATRLEPVEDARS